jgi:hypothetical protein
MMSSRLALSSRFSKMADTGIRVPLNSHVPLTLPGTLFTAGHSPEIATNRDSPWKGVLVKA